MNTNKTNALLLSLLVIISILFSCKKEVFNTVPEEENPTTPVVGGGTAPSGGGCDTLNYADDSKILFDTKCANAGCHDGSTQSPNLNSLTSIQANKAKVENRVFGVQNMPPAGSPALTDSEKDILKRWLDCGAKGIVAPPPVKSTWKDVSSIFVAKCATCHPGTGPGDFKTYDAVKTIVTNGRLNDRVFVARNMPPARVTQLTKEEEDKIKKWINDGANND